METVEAVVFIAVFAGFGAINLALALALLFKRKITGRALIPLVLLTVFAGLTAAAVVTHANFTRFGLLHLAYIAFFACLGVALNIYVRSPLAQKIMRFVFSGIFLAFISVRLFYPIPVYHRIPLNICNIATVMIILRPFLRTNFTDNYLLCFCLLGAVMSNATGEFFTSSGNPEFFYYEGFVSNTLHCFFISYCLYMILKREIKFSQKKAMLNLPWMIALFSVLIFTNQIWEYNYFYTSVYRNPLIAVYNLFPVFNITLGGFTFEINMLYYVVLISGSALVLLAFTGILRLIERLRDRAGARKATAAADQRR